MSLTSIIAMLAGVAVILVTFLLLHIIDDKWDGWKKSVRSSEGEAEIFIREVTIAADLVPLILGLSNLKGSMIRILGDDGSYIVNKNGNVLKNGLQKWVNKGLTIQYVLLSLEEDVATELLALQSQLGETAFDVRILDRDAVADDEEMGEILAEFRTEHPTLFFGHDGRNALWLEGHHPPRSVYAYDVHYVSPNAMTPEWIERFNAFRSKTDKIWDSCKKLHYNREIA